MTENAARSVRSVYFDGITSALHEVMVACTPSGVQIRNPDDSLIVEWPYERLKHLNAPDHIFRIGLRKSDKLERLEIDDQDIAHAIDLACPDIDRSGASARAERRQRHRLELRGRGVAVAGGVLRHPADRRPAGTSLAAGDRAASGQRRRHPGPRNVRQGTEDPSLRMRRRAGRSRRQEGASTS